MQDNDEVRRDMRRLLRVVEELRKHEPRMELGQVAVLLSVLTDPGVWAVDVKKRVGLQSSSLTRNVQGLSSRPSGPEGGQEGKPGLGLITQIPDAADRRAMQLAPTKKGRHLAEKLSELMKG